MIRSTSQDVVKALRDRGDYWEATPGVGSMRGELLELGGVIAAALERVARDGEPESWSAPAALPFETLAEADYFASFPQWLTAASHLSGDPAVLERVAKSDRPAAAARAALAPAVAVLPPALCYHVYAALANRTLAEPAHVTLQGTCWRHEGERTAPLERGWAFTMREAVTVGSAEAVQAFIERGIERTLALAAALGLDADIVPATDPFFAPTARGRTLLQQVKGLKRELVLPLGGDRTVAAASFNHHETFFGDAFGIRTADGAAAASGCVAFGLERWLLAFLVAHGPEPMHWPEVA